MLSEYSKPIKSVREVEYHNNQLFKYLDSRKLDKEIWEQYLNSQREETIAERVKLIAQKKKKKNRS